MINKAGIDLIKSHEGCSLVAYQDQGGVWTIGYGHTQGVKQGDVCTQVEAAAWLLEDITEAEKSVRILVEQPLNENQFAALVSFVYNMGPMDLGRSTLLHFLNKGNYEDAEKEFIKWDKVCGTHNSGQLRRREAEACLFGTGI